MNPAEPSTDGLACSFEDAQRIQLLAWARLSASAKIDFFEEMIQLAYHSGALTPERLALRERSAVDWRNKGNEGASQ